MPNFEATFVATDYRRTLRRRATIAPPGATTTAITKMIQPHQVTCFTTVQRTWNSASELQELQHRIDVAEQACLTKLFQKSRDDANDWLARAAKLLSTSAVVQPADVPAIMSGIDDLKGSGEQNLQDLARYVKSGSFEAKNVYKTVDSEISVLQRTKLWLYNQQVLRR